MLAHIHHPFLPPPPPVRHAPHLASSSSHHAAHCGASLLPPRRPTTGHRRGRHQRSLCRQPPPLPCKLTANIAALPHAPTAAPSARRCAHALDNASAAGGVRTVEQWSGGEVEAHAVARRRSRAGRPSHTRQRGAHGETARARRSSGQEARATEVLYLVRREGAHPTVADVTHGKGAPLHPVEDVVDPLPLLFLRGRRRCSAHDNFPTGQRE